jgi:hypothetical protein
MSEKKFKTMKVFDCQDMPQDVRDILFKTCGSPSFRGGNDCYVKMYVLEQGKPIQLVEPDKCRFKDNKNFKLYEDTGKEIIDEYIASGVRYVKQRGDHPVGDWLFDNGAKVNEEVIVKHWW